MLVLGLVTRPPADALARISSLAGRRPTVVGPAVWRCLTAASILLCLALPASRAEAHAVPAAMDPAPDARLDAAPPMVVIRFTERVEPHTSSLEVLDAKGARVTRGEGTVDPADPWRYRVSLGPLQPGAYTVSWRVLSADDGHVTSGAHVFTVGVAGPAEQSGPTVRSGGGWRPLARWLVALGGALLLGALVGGPLLGLTETRWIRGMEGLGVMAVAVGGTLDLVLQARALAGARSTVGVLGTLLVTPPGLVWLVRSGLLALLAILLTAGASRMGARRLRLGVPVLVVMLGGLVTHGAALVDGRWPALSAEMLHLLAVTAWAGGLLAFGTVFWRASESVGAGAEIARLALAMPAFSGLAVLAVGILSVSGLFLARLHLGAWTELLGTPYGRWLGAKLAVFAAMLALAAWHQGWVTPRLARALAGGEMGLVLVAGFRRSVRLEATLGVVALALAGVLGVTAPPAPAVPSAASQPGAPGFRHERALDDARVRLEITPLHPGPNAIRLAITDPAGRPLADATAALVQVTPVDASVGAVTFQLDRVGPGEFAAPSAVLGLVGRWSGRLVVQRVNAYDVNDRFELLVTEAATPHVHDVPAALPPRPVPLDRVTAGAILAIAAASISLFARSRRQLENARRLLDRTPQTPAHAPASR
jgi:copper transport protein